MKDGPDISGAEKPIGTSVVRLGPGLCLVGGLTALSMALASTIALPAILIALGLGLLASSAYRRVTPLGRGVDWAADPLMKASVAGLGAGVDFMLITTLGWPVLLSIVLAIAATFAIGVFIARVFNGSKALSILASGAVAICGSSAALALCCALPKDERRMRDLSLIIISVSVLSTAAMIAYPILTRFLGMGELSSGFVLGGAIHNVAQAVAAGFSISETTGDTATLVKMVRVTLLAPIVMMVAFAFRKDRPGAGDDTRNIPAKPPAFLIAFAVLMVFGTGGLIPGDAERWIIGGAQIGLIASMAAIGLATPRLGFGPSERRIFSLVTLLTAVMLLVTICATMLLDLDA